MNSSNKKRGVWDSFEVLKELDCKSRNSSLKSKIPLSDNKPQNTSGIIAELPKNIFQNMQNSI